MGRVSLYHRSIVYNIIILVLVLVVYALMTIAFVENPKVDTVRIKTEYNQAVFQISKGSYDIDKKFAVIDNTGKVTYSTIDYFVVNDMINPGSINSFNQKYFIQAIEVDGSISNYVFLEIDINDYEYYNYAYLFFSLVLIMLIAFMACRYCIFLSKDVFTPILDIHKETKEIANGNYEYKLQYDYKTEVGSLSHDIEALRDELKNSSLREKKLRENEKLLLACISHDLKTPVATISGYAEGIRDGVCKSPEQLEKYCSTIINKTMVLTKLIDDILEHSNLELNEFSINQEEIYSNEFFDKVFSDLSSDVASKKIEYEVAECPLAMLNIDPKRITQVVANIVGNSIKYTGENGKISVNFQVTDRFAVSISDTGKGIDASDIPFVFDKFFRGERARTQSIPGSGLGLSICRSIIEKHGGEIECDSLLNVGTTITFYLPLAK